MTEANIIEILESNYQIFKEEFDRINVKLLHAWPETKIYKGEWLTFGLHFNSKHILPNVNLCPKSVSILDNIPGLTNAGFSVLNPMSRIHPHKGYTDKVFRYHLGISIPSTNVMHCGLHIMHPYKETEPNLLQIDQINWVNGKAFKFDDTFTHSAHNYTNESRVVLLIDVFK
jgi:beta-hydroxylase